MADEQIRNGVRHQYTTFERKHMTLAALLEDPDLSGRRYLHDDIPLYPHPEFHIKKVSHVTSKPSLEQIMESGGFKAGQERRFSYWSLRIEEDEKTAAERRFLSTTFPPDAEQGEEEEARPENEPFLSKFTTSPAFQEGSRYGNYRFTFPIQRLLELYGAQFCGGEPPEMRVYNTEFYKQEIMYIVLVHRPDMFEDFPVLGGAEDAEAVCAYQSEEGSMVWRAQAICNDHQYEMVINRVNKTITAQKHQQFLRYFVWDHVVLAFHIPEGQVFKVEKRELCESLTACDAVQPYLGSPLDTYEEAKQVIDEIKTQEE